MTITPEYAALLRCPIDGAALTLSTDGNWLENHNGNRRYPIRDGIAMLLPEHAQALTAPEEPHHD